MKIWQRGITLYLEHQFTYLERNGNSRIILTTFAPLYYIQNLGIELIRSKQIDKYGIWYVRSGRWDQDSVALWNRQSNIWFPRLDKLQQYCATDTEIVFRTKVSGLLIEPHSEIELRWGPRTPSDRKYDKQIQEIIIDIADALGEERV